jgi:hypothetical protein
MNRKQHVKSFIVSYSENSEFFLFHPHTKKKNVCKNLWVKRGEKFLKGFLRFLQVFFGDEARARTWLTSWGFFMGVDF